MEDWNAIITSSLGLNRQKKIAKTGNSRLFQQEGLK
jgi:hypothetical protein